MSPLKTITLSTGFFLLISCTTTYLIPRTSTEKQSSIGRNEYAPPPTKAMAKNSQTSFEDLQGGYGIYMRKCGECHIHILPHEASEQKWHAKVPGMSWDAGLEREEEDDLLKYLIAARKNHPTMKQ